MNARRKRMARREGGARRMKKNEIENRAITGGRRKFNL
jgi:hypothetical protein